MLMFKGIIIIELIHVDTGEGMADKAQGMKNEVRLSYLPSMKCIF